MRSCDQLGLLVPPRWQCQRTVLRCLARLRSKHPIQTGPSVSLNRLCKQGGWGEEVGGKPNWPQIPLSNTSKQNNPSRLFTPSFLLAFFFFLISPGAEASAEPGWRRVRACSLPVLHRNEAYGTYWRSSPCSLGTAATTLRVQEAGQELFSEALRRDLHEEQGLRCMRDCAMNLALTGLPPLLLPENPQQQTQDTESSSPHHPQNRAEKHSPRELILSNSLSGCLKLHVCVQTRGQLACGLFLVLHQVWNFQQAGWGARYCAHEPF